MFLDPDPKRKSKSMSAQSGFFSSQRPIESPRDIHRTTVRRKELPLHERSPSRNNQQQNPPPSPEKPTVRLVKPSPPKVIEENNNSDDNEPENSVAGKENRQDVAGLLVKPASAAKPGFPGFAASSQDINVSDLHNRPNEARSSNPSNSYSLLSTNPNLAAAGPRKEWHRRSGSTGNYSTSSTLKESDTSIFGGQRSESRFSQGTTLRGTPTPYEQEFRERVDVDDSELSQVSVPTLYSLREASPDSTTVRVVPPSQGSDASERPLSSEHSESSIVERPQTSPQSYPDSEQRPPVPRRSSRRSSSASSLPEPLNIRKTSGSPTPRHQRSQESLAQSEATIPAPSSPNFVAYQSDSSRPQTRSRSGTHPLHYSYSIESIQSRLQYPTVIRPDTGRSVATSSSQASLQPESPSDTLPPLQIPKKRLRHKPASLSLNQAARSAYAWRKKI